MTRSDSRRVILPASVGNKQKALALREQTHAQQNWCRQKEEEKGEKTFPASHVWKEKRSKKEGEIGAKSDTVAIVGTNTKPLRKRVRAQASWTCWLKKEWKTVSALRLVITLAQPFGGVRRHFMKSYRRRRVRVELPLRLTVLREREISSAKEIARDAQR